MCMVKKWFISASYIYIYIFKNPIKRILAPQKNCSEFGFFGCSNSGLASLALDDEVMRWPLRPKQHQFEHLIFDFGVWVNPRHFSCMLDEDLIGRLKKITTHTHPKTMSVRALEHYAICVASLWVGDLFGWNCGGKKLSRHFTPKDFHVIFLCD